jgi:hypothetical protein
MGREPAKRENYRADALTVHRILRAIEIDDTCSPEWKTEATIHLKAAFNALLRDHRPTEKTAHED